MQGYNNLTSMEFDILKEIGSIGAGNAATALSSVLGMKVKMNVPSVSIYDYEDAINLLGGPETIAVGILVRLTGDVEGLMLFIQRLELVNITLKQLMGKEVEGYEELNDLDVSALNEIGNIITGSYINSIAKLTGLTIQISVPALTVNMIGGILSVPMVEYGYEADKIMIINGSFFVDEKEITSDLILVPDVKSLNILLEKLGV